jgi:hypothetical protein
MKKLGITEDKKKLAKKKSNFLNSNTKNDDIQCSKTFKKSQLSDNKTNLKKKLQSRRRSNGIRNKLKLDNFGKKNEGKSNISIDYFSKEQKNENDCRII